MPENSTHVATLAELKPLTGQVLGSSSWFEVPQQRIDAFAEATGDRQWIHIDPERARQDGPFGGPIAHGYLILSLVIPMWNEVLAVDSVNMAINYGLNRVRFTQPVPAGGRVRLVATLEAFEELPKGGAQLTVGGAIEIENGERPAVVFEAIYRFLD
jgi:acyl dehydratase